MPVPHETQADAPTILIIDDHEATLTSLRVLLRRQGWRVETASGGREGLERLLTTAPDLALIDLDMDDLDGLSVIAQLREHMFPPPCVMISAENSVPAAVEAMRIGARDFLVKPLAPKPLIERISSLLDESRRHEESGARLGWRDVYAPGLVGDHDRLVEMFSMLERIAPTEDAVLVRGERGSGQELVARAIHAASERRHGPFIALNCASVPNPLLERELFGQARGPQSGVERRGYLSIAEGGTLFLDEIHELPRVAQAKLLRVLHEGRYARAGETRSHHVDTRIIAASTRSLQSMVERDRFDRDLLHQLARLPIHLPPLRERESDIPLLAEHFLAHASARLGHEGMRLSPRALAGLSAHTWTGNIRELQQLIELGLSRCTGEVLELEHLFPDAAPIPAPPSPSLFERIASLQLPRAGVDLRLLLTVFEQGLIEQALERTKGNRSRAAQLLKLNRTTLVEKLRRKRELPK